jgi:hypothetical protein
MNENTKTISFAGVAAVLLAAGIWINLPSSPDVRIEIGQKFFPEFNVAIGDQNKVDVVAGAQIVEVSADTSVKRAIDVERIDGAWQINPGKQGYPDMSVDRLADVVKTVRDLKKLDISSQSPDEHRRFGVVDPTDAESLKAGADGVGKLVTIQDASRSTLVKLIVGKKDEKKSGLSYVREPGHDAVYLTEIDPSPLSTRFEDWVKPDLLEEADGDIRTVSIDDHAIDAEKVRENQGIFIVERNVAKPIFKAEAELKKNDAGDWTFDRFETFDKEKQQFAPRKLTEEEQIDASKLFTLRGALGRVKIVDAVKKVPVLAEDLAGATNFLSNPASKVRTDEQSIRDLRIHGFIPSLKAKGSQEIELINHEGDMNVGFADGVEFTLRFGDITGRGQADPAKAGGEGAKAEDAKPAEGAAGATDSPATGSNTAPSRYLMITASFNPDLVPKPKLQELPPEQPAATPAKPEETKPENVKKEEGAKAAEPAKTEPAKTEPAKTDGAPSGSCDDQEPKKEEPEKKEPEQKPAEVAKPTGSPSATSPSATSPTATPTATPSATKPTATGSPTATPTGTPTAKPTGTATAKPEEKKPEETKPAEAKPAPKPMTPEERERITAANKQAQTAYDEQLKAGREKAERLNKKFAAWFYVVSSTTYEDLNIDPTTLVKSKAAAPPPGPPPGGGLPPGMNMQDIQRMIQQQQPQR